MSDAWSIKPVGPRVSELEKSTLPAGLAEDHGAFPFYCSSPQVRRINRAITSTPSILMGTGGVATVHLGQGSFAYSTDTWAFTIADPFTDLRFLYRQLQHRLPEIDYAGFGGSGLRHLNKDHVRSLALPVPPLPEQSAIARILDVLDISIRETEAVIAKLKAVKRGLLHDLLTRGIDANGELRPPQAEAPHLYKQSPLGWIPRGWEPLTLEQVTDTPICYGIVQVFGFVPNGVPVLAIKDLNGDYATGIHRTALRIDAAYPRSRVRPGDVLLSIKGTLGKVGVVPSHFTGNVSRDIALIRPAPTVRSQYLAQMLQSTVGQKLLSLAQVGTTRGEISIAPLRRIVVPLPDIEEQQRLEASLEASEGRIKQEELTLQKLRSEKAGLMDDLLTGRVRVTPLLAAEQQGGA